MRDADDRRALHELIAIKRGETTRYYELSGWKARGPVELVLAAAKLAGGGGGGLEVAVVEPPQTPIKLRGFVVPPGEASDIGTMLQRAFTGGLGGFHSVVVGLTGFHAAPMVFEYLRSAAGSPSVITCHPELVEGTASSGAPSSLTDAADADATLRAIRALEGGG
ncbi:MAG: hypothetical protein KC731_24115 [Myxococcales bacterium]|nr:hypothetical protein [Myxococcales bacterium]